MLSASAPASNSSQLRSPLPSVSSRLNACPISLGDAPPKYLLSISLFFIIAEPHSLLVTVPSPSLSSVANSARSSAYPSSVFIAFTSARVAGSSVSNGVLTFGSGNLSGTPAWFIACSAASRSGSLSSLATCPSGSGVSLHCCPSGT